MGYSMIFDIDEIIKSRQIIRGILAGSKTTSTLTVEQLEKAVSRHKTLVFNKLISILKKGKLNGFKSFQNVRNSR